jgi:NADPH:quinone reductase-like Zn-dependent oxidoreductase
MNQFEIQKKELSMRAVVITGYGDEDVVQVRDVPKPQIHDDEVLVEVHSACINPIDVKVRKGKMKPLLTYKFPLILGTDVSGKVVEIGSGVSRFKEGEEVYASLSTSRMGAFGEYVAIHENHLSLKPDNLSFEEAASLPLVGLTVYQALHDVAKLTPGQKVFIKAGSGGIGTFAIQFAKASGAEVATTTSAKNVEWVRRLGADHVIDYQKQRFEEVLSDYDVVLDSVDGEPVARGFSILKRGGHLLSVVGPPDAKFAKKAGLNLFLQLLCGLLAWKVSKLSKKTGAQYTFVFAKPDGRQLDEIRILVENGKIKPVVDRVFPMNQVREALSYVALGRSKGKVVLRVR